MQVTQFCVVSGVHVSVMLEPEGLMVAADRGFIERAEQLLGQGAVQAFE